MQPERPRSAVLHERRAAASPHSVTAVAAARGVAAECSESVKTSGSYLSISLITFVKVKCHNFKRIFFMLISVKKKKKKRHVTSTLILYNKNTLLYICTQAADMRSAGI